MSAVVAIEFVVYLGAMLAIGFYFSRRKMTQADYHLGGKKLPGWALALSERSTGESAWCLLGLTGFAYASGLSAIWIAAGCVLGITVSWVWLAREFRRERDKYDVLTLSDYLAAKYPERGRAIRWLSSLVIVFFFLFYVSAQFSGGGKTLDVTFGLSPLWGILLSAVVVTLYSMAGGFFSVVWTDTAQAVLMILSLVVTPIVALAAIAGRNLSLGAALAASGTHADSLGGGLTGLALGIMLFNNFSWFFGYMGGQPQLSTRWMAMKTDRDVRTGAWIAIVWTLFAYAGAILIGLAGIAIYGAGSLADPEQVFPRMVVDLMPPWLAGLMLTGAAAAMMSTASSQLLVATSSVSEDIVHKALRRTVNDRQLVLISRVAISVIGLLALALAFVARDLIYYVVGWAWAGIGCTFSPIVVLAFFWKRLSAAGVVAALVSGFVGTVVWMTMGLDKVFTARAATFFIVLAFAVAFSLVFPRRTADADPRTPA